MDKSWNTPLFLQEALKEDLEKLFKGDLFKNPYPNGEAYIPMKIYEQSLPLPVVNMQESPEAVIDSRTI